jgi:diaminopimelate epimerase
VAGEIIPQILSNGMVVVDMGEPILITNKIPTLLIANNDNKVINSPLEILGKTYYISVCSMGNPHGIIFVDNLDTMDPPISIIGPILENHEIFPEKANIEFVQIISKSHVLMQVWERGSGLTLACGTGSCAAVVAGVLNNFINRNCTVTLPGGDLDINWKEDNNKVFMTGNAVYVFRGNICLD